MKEYEKSGWFKITVPDDWSVDEDEKPIAVYHPDGPGAIQITVETPRPLKPGERIDVFLVLRAFLRGVGVEMDDDAAARYSENGLEWATYEYVGESPEGDVFWRLWLATNHDLLAFLTYACPAEDKSEERAVVGEIVKTLVLF